MGLFVKKSGLDIGKKIALQNLGNNLLEGRIIEISSGKVTILRRLAVKKSKLLVKQEYSLKFNCFEDGDFIYELFAGKKEIYSPQDKPYSNLMAKLQPPISLRNPVRERVIQTTV